MDHLSSASSSTLAAAAGATLAVGTLVALYRASGSKSDADGTGKPPPVWRSGLPLVGPFLAFGADPLGTVRRARDECGDVFTIPLLTENVTFLVGPGPHAAFFNAQDEELDQSDPYKFMTPIFGPGVVYDTDLNRRRQQLRALAASLKPANLRQYPPIIADEARNYFASRWGNKSGTADIHHTFADLIIKTGSAALMGHEIRTQLFDEMYRLYQDLDKGLTPLSVFFPYAPTAAHARRDRARREIGELFGRVISKRRDDPEASKGNDDILQRLMEFRYTDGTPLLDEEIAGMLVATLFAAQHTSNVVATWTTLFLLDDKRRGGNLLERVLHEMRSVEPEPGAFAAGRGIEYSVVLKQTFLAACVKEAIRMFPPIIFLMRRCLVDLKVSATVTVPKGHMVMVSNAYAQRLPEVFDRPDEYIPDRWATWDISKLPRYSFIGFGAGVHTCLGESFAFLQSRSILNVLLSTYDLELTTPFPTPDYESIVVMPHGPNIVKFTPKSQTGGASGPAAAPLAFAPVAEGARPKAVFVAEADANTQFFTREEVAKHTKKDDCWIIVRGQVYDVSGYLHLHQGGDEAILRVAGKDATEQVEGPQHPGTVPSLLERFRIGRVRE